MWKLELKSFFLCFTVRFDFDFFTLYILFFQQSSVFKEKIRHLESTLNDVTKSRDKFEQELFVKEEIVQQLRHELQDIGRKNSELNSANNQEVDKIMVEVAELDLQLNTTRYGHVTY